MKLLANKAVFSRFQPGRSSINYESCIDPDFCEDFINKGLNEELLPVLRHKFFTQIFCHGPTLNGCCAKLASSLNAKVSLFIYLTLENIKMCFFNFHGFHFSAPSRCSEVKIMKKSNGTKTAITSRSIFRKKQ